MKESMAPPESLFGRKRPFADDGVFPIPDFPEQLAQLAGGLLDVQDLFLLAVEAFSLLVEKQDEGNVDGE